MLEGRALKCLEQYYLWTFTMGICGAALIASRQCPGPRAPIRFAGKEREGLILSFQADPGVLVKGIAKVRSWLVWGPEEKLEA